MPVDPPDLQAASLADGLIAVLENDKPAGALCGGRQRAVRRYDWSVVASQIMRVYEICRRVGRQGPGGQPMTVGPGRRKALVVLVAFGAQISDGQPAETAERAQTLSWQSLDSARATSWWWHVRWRSTQHGGAPRAVGWPP